MARVGRVRSCNRSGSGRCTTPRYSFHLPKARDRNQAMQFAREDTIPRAPSSLKNAANTRCKYDVPGDVVSIVCGCLSLSEHLGWRCWTASWVTFSIIFLCKHPCLRFIIFSRDQIQQIPPACALITWSNASEMNSLSSPGLVWVVFWKGRTRDQFVG